MQTFTSAANLFKRPRMIQWFWLVTSAILQAEKFGEGMEWFETAIAIKAPF